MNTRTIETRKGIACDVREAGSGPPLLYLHGAGGLFAEEPLLEGLATSFHVVAPEWPGYGEQETEGALEDMLDFALHGWDVIDALTHVHLLPIQIDRVGEVALQRLFGSSEVAPADLDRYAHEAAAQRQAGLDRIEGVGVDARLLQHGHDHVGLKRMVGRDQRGKRGWIRDRHDLLGPCRGAVVAGRFRERGGIIRSERPERRLHVPV